MLDASLITPLGVIDRQQLLLTTFDAQLGLCYYCKLTMYVDRNAAGINRQNRATIEHLVPQSFGGCSCAINLVVACQRCNSMRGHIPIAVFLKLLAKVFETERFKAAWHDDSREARYTLKRVSQVFARADRMRVPPTLSWPPLPR